MAVVYLTETGPQIPFNDKQFFKGLFGPITRDPSGVKYLPLGSKNNSLKTDTLILRPCYEHLLPHIHNPLYLEEEEYFRCAVTGTPGIGKTVFGAYLLRHFLIEKKQSVLYWAHGQIYLFSFDEEVQNFYGLTAYQEMVPDGSPVFFAGKWDAETATTTTFIHWAKTHNIVFIHDPDNNRETADNEVSIRQDNIPHLIFIVSFGHQLIHRWRSKGYDITYFYMPLWTKQEAEQCKQFLNVRGRPGISTIADLDQFKIDDLYYRFGGCIRGWVTNDDVLWAEIEAKITDVVREMGDNILQRTANSKGAVIHQEVEFDEQRPIVAFAGTDTSQKVLGNTGNSYNVVKQDEKPNDFCSSHYIFGSEKILEVFRERILNRGKEMLTMCLKNWAGKNGFESVYGALFELHCHRMLENNKGHLQLNMRIVHQNKAKNTDHVYKVKFPVTKGTLQYPSNDPSILDEDQHKDDVKTIGKYFWPISNNHPTYDSAVVVNGKDLGVDKLKEDKIALLLQMTVSGATGLPRRPEHSVKQHVRKKFEDVFKKGTDGYQQSGQAYTAFMVPTECFRPFLFQVEELSNGGTAVSQPEFQLVFEVPNVFTYKKGSPRGTAQAAGQFSFSGKKRKAWHLFDEEESSQSQK